MREAAWVRERKKYGRTPQGDWVDSKQLTGLAGMGYDRRLAAEALRRCVCVYGSQAEHGRAGQKL